MQLVLLVRVNFSPILHLDHRSDITCTYNRILWERNKHNYDDDDDIAIILSVFSSAYLSPQPDISVKLESVLEAKYFF